MHATRQPRDRRLDPLHRQQWRHAAIQRIPMTVQ